MTQAWGKLGGGDSERESGIGKECGKNKDYAEVNGKLSKAECQGGQGLRWNAK